jgi:hypothetical protein
MYQRIDYSGPASTGYVDYNYMRADPALTWQVSQKTRLNIGPYVSRYESKDTDLRSDAIGGSFGVSSQWSQLWKTDFSVYFERDKLDQGGPVVLADDSTSEVGASLSGTRRGEVSTTQFSIGRLITPSGNGAIVTSDQLQISYLRNLSARTAVTLAGSYNHDSEVFALGNQGDSWKYASALAQFQWRVRPQWFFEAGYQYVWRRYDFQTRAADNSGFSLRFGYEGLGPRR